jgi:hypothetical protein
MASRSDRPTVDVSYSFASSVAISMLTFRQSLNLDARGSTVNYLPSQGSAVYYLNVSSMNVVYESGKRNLTYLSKIAHILSKAIFSEEGWRV